MRKAVGDMWRNDQVGSARTAATADGLTAARSRDKAGPPRHRVPVTNNQRADRADFNPLSQSDLAPCSSGHFASTQLLGVTDVKTSAGRLGHTPKVMLETYAHGIAERDAAAAVALGQIIVTGLPK